MTQLNKRKWIDAAFALVVYMIVAFACHWSIVILVLIHGLWNYYDGLTRYSLDAPILPDEVII